MTIGITLSLIKMGIVVVATWWALGKMCGKVNK